MLSLIHTLCSSLHHVLSLLSLLLSSPVVAWWWIPTVSSASMPMFLLAGDCLTTNSYSSVISRLFSIKSKSKLLYDWWFTVNQFVLASSHLRLTTRDLFSQLNLCSDSRLCNILSDKKMNLSLVNILGPSSSVHFAHIACYWTFFLLHYTQVLCQYRLCRADHAYFTYLMLQQ
jgi:hypothetical protein